MPATMTNERVLCLFHIKEIAKLFDRGWLSTLRWRKEKGMPYITIPGPGRPAIRFDLEEIEPWAKMHSLPMNQEVLRRLRRRLKNSKKE